MLLLSMSAPQHVGDDVYPWNPSAYITFTFQSVSISVDAAVRIPMNSTFLLQERDSFFLSMWFSATKYAYPIQVHLVSIPIDRIFLEIWVGGCTGDIIVRCARVCGGRCVCVCAGAWGYLFTHVMSCSFCSACTCPDSSPPGRLSPELKWSNPDEDFHDCLKYGTIINHGAWNHLFVVFTRKQQTEKRGAYEVCVQVQEWEVPVISN